MHDYIQLNIYQFLFTASHTQLSTDLYHNAVIHSSPHLLIPNSQIYVFRLNYNTITSAILNITLTVVTVLIDIQLRLGTSNHGNRL